MVQKPFDAKCLMTKRPRRDERSIQSDSGVVVLGHELRPWQAAGRNCARWIAPLLPKPICSCRRTIQLRRVCVEPKCNRCSGPLDLAKVRARTHGQWIFLGVSSSAIQSLHLELRNTTTFEYVSSPSPRTPGTSIPSKPASRTSCPTTWLNS